MPRTLILCPTFDHQDTLFAALTSARRQTDSDWELVVIGDGAPDRTRDIVAGFSDVDPRIRYVAHPKSPRIGEPYRDAEIRACDCDVVMQLTDDDLFGPSHVATMTGLLEHGDFAMQAALQLLPDGQVMMQLANMAWPAARAIAGRRHVSQVGPHFTAYRRQAYLALDEGWTTSPPEQPASDTYMWAKFYRDSRVRIVTSASSTAVRFPAQARATWAPERRLAEILPWMGEVQTPGALDAMRRRASVANHFAVVFLEWRDLPVDNAEEALAHIGFNLKRGPTVSDAMSYTTDGDRLDLSLSDDQVAQCAWAFDLYRAVAHGDASAGDRVVAASPEAWRAPGWARIIRVARSNIGAEAALRAAEIWAATMPDRPAPAAARVELLAETNQVDAATDALAAALRSWPKAEVLAQAARALDEAKSGD